MNKKKCTDELVKAKTGSMVQLNFELYRQNGGK